MHRQVMAFLCYFHKDFFLQSPFIRLRLNEMTNTIFAQVLEHCRKRKRRRKTVQTSERYCNQLYNKLIFISFETSFFLNTLNFYIFHLCCCRCLRCSLLLSCFQMSTLNFLLYSKSIIKFIMSPSHSFFFFFFCHFLDEKMKLFKS